MNYKYILLIVVLSIGLSLDFAFADDISQCGTLSGNNKTYNIKNDLIGLSYTIEDCLIVTGSNNIINCNGNKINNSTYVDNAIGISLKGINNTVKNCYFNEGLYYGVVIEGTASQGDQSKIISSTFYKNNTGIKLNDYSLKDITIQKNTFTENTNVLEFNNNANYSNIITNLLFTENTITNPKEYIFLFPNANAVLNNTIIKYNKFNSNNSVYLFNRKTDSETVKNILIYGDIYNNEFVLSNYFSTNGFSYTVDLNTIKTNSPNIVGKPYLGGNYWGKPNKTGFSDKCETTDGIFCKNNYVLGTGLVDYLALTTNSQSDPDNTGTSLDPDVDLADTTPEDFFDFNSVYSPDDEDTLPEECTQNTDFSVTNIEFPDDVYKDEDNTVQCFFKNLGKESTNTTLKIKLNIYNTEDEDEDEYNTEAQITSQDAGGAFGCGQEYYITFYDFQPESEDDYNAICSLEVTNPPGFSEDKLNNVFYEEINPDSPRPDLSVDDIDVTDEAERGEVIDITCEYGNQGSEDTDPDGTIELELNIDNDTVETVDIDPLDADEDDEYTFYYEVDNSYDDGDKMEVECKLNYEEEDNDFREKTTSNNKMEVDVEIDGDYDGPPQNYGNINMIVSSISVNNPVVVNQSNNIRCMVQNIGQGTATNYFYLKYFYDGSLLYTKTVYDNISSYGTYYADYPYTFISTGLHKVKCEIYYIGSEYSTSDNTKEYEFTVYATAPESNDQGSSGTGSGTNNGNNGGVIVGPTNEPVYILVMDAVIINSYIKGKADVTCRFSNIGDASLNGYEVMMTLNEKLVKSDIINSAIGPNSASVYNTTIDVGYDGGLLGCIIKPLDNEKVAVSYVELEKRTNYGVVLMIVGILILVVVIIYLIYKFV